MTKREVRNCLPLNRKVTFKNDADLNSYREIPPLSNSPRPVERVSPSISIPCQKSLPPNWDNIRSQAPLQEANFRRPVQNVVPTTITSASIPFRQLSGDSGFGMLTKQTSKIVADLYKDPPEVISSAVPSSTMPPRKERNFEKVATTMTVYGGMIEQDSLVKHVFNIIDELKVNMILVSVG